MFEVAVVVSVVSTHVASMVSQRRPPIRKPMIWKCVYCATPDNIHGHNCRNCGAPQIKDSLNKDIRL